MDESKYCELEAKYDASSLPVSDFESEMRKMHPGGPIRAKTVVGIDTFFSDTKKVLRFRRKRLGTTPMGVDKPALTYKCRRRDGDISDRTEIDMWLGPDATDQDVRAMMEVMGMKESFTITKESWIYHVADVPIVQHKGEGNIDIVFALYDVLHNGLVHRYLEVEIERKGDITSQWATQRLDHWKGWIKEHFPGVGDPLNTSLYEMFAPRDDLFVPESF